MFEFGKEFRRFFKNSEDIKTDPSLFELLNVTMLTNQARANDILSGRVSTKDRHNIALDAAAMWAEAARRSGDALLLKKATIAAEYAGRTATSVTQAAFAALMQAEICLLTLDLFNSGDMLALAESLLTTSRLPSQNDSELSLVFAVTEAKVLARRAARDGIETDLEASLKAMAHLDSVINRVDKDYLKKGTPYLKLFAVKIRFERADLLLLIAKDRADSQIPKAIITEFEALVPRLDAFSEPVATALVFVRLAQAYILLGQIEGDLEQIAQGIGILSRDEASNPYDHSPVDYVIHKQTLGLGLAAMGERTQSQALFEQAIKAMDLALSKPIPSGVMAMLMIYNDRLGIKSAKAESGAFDDLIALISFLKSELKALDAKRAPILWAILQANIARLYIINSEHLGQSKDRLEALYALTAAYDIFEEQGLGALMSTTRHWLARAQTQS